MCRLWQYIKYFLVLLATHLKPKRIYQLFFSLFTQAAFYKNAIKVAHRYWVHVSDTTMMTIAAALPGQKFTYCHLKILAAFL